MVKADGKLGQQKLGFLDNRGVSAVYSDYRTGNKILSCCTASCTIGKSLSFSGIP